MTALPYWLDVLIKLLVATVLGGVVGWQRETRERPAGLRTHILVCVGSAVYTLASVAFLPLGGEPSRVAAQVATGMGFLGAGTIIRHGNVVRGLTTAASLWAVAAIGICVAMGGCGYWIAGIATALVLLTLTVLQRAESKLGLHGSRATLTVRLHGGAGPLRAALDIIQSRGMAVDSYDLSGVLPGGLRELSVALRVPAGSDPVALTADLSEMEGCAGVRLD
jgi:putative Mg2+ transporter-C (MgtC) family protein